MTKTEIDYDAQMLVANQRFDGLQIESVWCGCIRGFCPADYSPEGSPGDAGEFELDYVVDVTVTEVDTGDVIADIDSLDDDRAAELQEFLRDLVEYETDVHAVNVEEVLPGVFDA